jgi:GT2 family glycosyltransferase
MGRRSLKQVADSNPKRLGVGGCIYRLKAVKQVGGFDRHIKGAGEDADITSRMVMSGWKLTGSSADLYHRLSETWKALWDKYFWYGYGDHYRAHKYRVRSPLLQRVPPVVFIGALKYSFPVYKLVHSKKAFLLPLQYLFKYTGWCLGYVKSHIDGYGHASIACISKRCPSNNNS